ncbi:MAG TPA: DHA2 family efflux MFS transporter permease subunit [Burkholderiales bacterium]|nr:DHA2 family efflux MFS transporter permease subunit [Burkholderiales bacterium]
MTGSSRHPALITASVGLASFLYSIDWTIAAVALPHMRGTFSATQDQIAWVITSYIVASALSIPAAGWLSLRFGRKRVFMWAVTVFLVASVACGAANSLAVEVSARIVQGLGGAFLIPLSHAIILDTYPPEEQGKAMALWGMAAVMGSFVGPTIGGYVTEYMSWRYIFYINVPFGALALAGAAAFLPETKRDPERRLDWFGFLSLSLGVGSLQLMLDRGGQLDWFESWEIITEAWLAVLGLYMFNVHCLTAKQPFLDPRLLAQRSFFLGLVFAFIYGSITTPPMVLMPSFLDQVRGYPIDTIGLLQAPRGIGLFCAMIIGGRTTGRIDPRKLIAFGLLCLAYSSWEMSTWNVDVGVWPLVWTNFMQGIGGGIILVPIQVIAFPSLEPHRRTEATAVYNLVRSIGASIGVSGALAMYVRTSSVMHAQLAEHVTPFNRALQAQGHEGWSMASTQALARLEREISLQSAVIGYTGDFLLFALVALAALPLLLFIGRQRLPGGAGDRAGGLTIGE